MGKFVNRLEVKIMFNKLISLIKNKKKLLSFLTILGTIALVGYGATIAFFQDTETSKDNILQAGKIDLLIDNTSYYNGEPSPDNTWTLDNLTDQLFFNFEDLKPGDWGEDTISLHVDNNDAWACMNISLTSDDDIDCTEPELEDDLTCDDPDEPVDAQDGELAENLQFVFWADDGDNVLEDNENTGEGIFKEGLADEVLDGQPVALADSLGGVLGIGGPMDPEATYYIGKAWCFGEMTLAPVAPGENSPTDNPGILCNGEPVNNASQTDKAMMDFSFYAVQHRNNETFVCSGERPSVTPGPSTTITLTPTPPLACTNADVMLVLDRSGSIDSPELTTLKTAAKDFVDSLALATAGNHAGKSSFATTGNLNHQLTDDPVSLKAAIDAMSSGGFTNLKEGIDLANGELASVRDRNDATSPDKMVIITDGNPNRPLPSSTADDVALASATAAKGAGVEIFVVGIGSDVNQSYLESVASGADHYYEASDYSGLQTVLDGLDICNSD